MNNQVITTMNPRDERMFKKPNPRHLPDQGIELVGHPVSQAYPPILFRGNNIGNGSQQVQGTMLCAHFISGDDYCIPLTTSPHSFWKKIFGDLKSLQVLTFLFLPACFHLPLPHKPWGHCRGFQPPCSGPCPGDMSVVKVLWNDQYSSGFQAWLNTKTTWVCLKNSSCPEKHDLGEWFPNLVPSPGASASSGNLTERLNLGPHPRCTESENVGVQPSDLCSNKHCRHSEALTIWSWSYGVGAWNYFSAPQVILKTNEFGKQYSSKLKTPFGMPQKGELRNVWNKILEKTLRKNKSREICHGIQNWQVLLSTAVPSNVTL